MLPSTILPTAPQRQSTVTGTLRGELLDISQDQCLYTHFIFWRDSHTWATSSTRKRQMIMTSRIQRPNSITGNTLMRRFSFSTLEVKLDLFRNHFYSTATHCGRGSMPSLNKISSVTTTLVGVFCWCLDELATLVYTGREMNVLDAFRRHSVYSIRSRVPLSENSVTTSMRPIRLVKLSLLA